MWSGFAFRVKFDGFNLQEAEHDLKEPRAASPPTRSVTTTIGFSPLLGTTSALGRHIVSLTFTAAYGLLTLDPPPAAPSAAATTPPAPPPRFTLGAVFPSPLSDPKSFRSESRPPWSDLTRPEIINSWELMAGLDTETSPCFFFLLLFSVFPRNRAAPFFLLLPLFLDEKVNGTRVPAGSGEIGRDATGKGTKEPRKRERGNYELAMCRVEPQMLSCFGRTTVARAYHFEVIPFHIR
ncbi:hypothetical protein NL676_004501 [Syzygium grande]|nr:hypothetical protein NL676_004501 [Syzygium grande]